VNPDMRNEWDWAIEEVNNLFIQNEMKNKWNTNYK
jgi:hypothetical protein